MEPNVITKSEFDILGILKKHKSLKKANNDLYRLLSVNDLWRNIYSLRAKGLIKFEFDQKTNKVVEISICEDVLNNLKNVIIEDDYIEANKSQIVENNKDIIRFKLQKTKADSIFSTQYGGVISFANKIVLEPDKKYIYAVFMRENENLILTLTPEEKVIQSAQHIDFQERPLHILHIIKGFLSDLEKDQ